MDAGVYTNPIVSPAVPRGRALLRTSCMATHTHKQLEFCLDMFEKPAEKPALSVESKTMKPRQSSSKTVLITGASSGIGKCTAAYLAAKGFRVYGTSRRPESCPEIKNGFMIPMDVRDTASVKKAIAHIVEKEGHIDILVNNAGVGIGGTVEDTSTEMVQALFDTNFSASAAYCRKCSR